MLTERSEHATANGCDGDVDMMCFYETWGSDETVAEAKAKLAEAEEYDRMLSKDADRAWRDEDKDVVEKTWRNASRVVQQFKDDVMRAEVAAEYKRALEKSRSQHNVVAQPMYPKELDGPRAMSDNIMGVGAAFSEIFEDVHEVYQGYFNAWNSATKWVSGK